MIYVKIRYLKEENCGRFGSLGPNSGLKLLGLQPDRLAVAKRSRAGNEAHQ